MQDNEDITHYESPANYNNYLNRLVTDPSATLIYAPAVQPFSTKFSESLLLNCAQFQCK